MKVSYQKLSKFQPKQEMELKSIPAITFESSMSEK